MLKQYCLSASLLLLTACASSPQNYIKPTQSFAIAVGEFSKSYKDYVYEYYYNQPLSMMKDVAFAPDIEIMKDYIHNEKYIPCNSEDLKQESEKGKCILFFDFISKGLSVIDDIDEKEKKLKLNFALADTVKKFSMVLLEIAQTDISGDFIIATHGLTKSLTSLQDTLELNPKLQKRTGAFADAIATIGGQIIEEKQAKILRETILKHEKTLNDIFDLMEKNIEIFDGGIKGMQERGLHYYIKQYEKNKEISYYREVWQRQFHKLRENENIIRDIDAMYFIMEDAKNELVRIAKDDKKIDSIEEVSISIENISFLSEKVKKAVQSLNN